MTFLLFKLSAYELASIKIEIKNMSQSELIKATKHLGMELIAESINLISENKVKLISNPDTFFYYI